MSMRPGSNASRGSAASRGSNYRTVAKDSYVDESLFGNNKPGQRPANKPSDVATFEKSKPAGRSTTVGGKKIAHPPEVVTLRRNDVDRMLGASPVKTAAEVAAIKRANEDRRARERAAANERKARMMRMEEERKKSVPPTETEALRAAKDGKTKSAAQFMLEEELDEVKAMNQMMTYAKCATIRDAQLEEKKHMMLEDEDEVRQLDLMMEVDRIRALENYEERARQRAEERKKGAMVLNEQIEERARERVRQEELRDQERIQMLKEMERLKELEIKAAEEKKQRAEALLYEVAAANAEQIERKKEIQVREAEEDARIAEYLRLKQLREQALSDEKARIAKEKELETARLRAQQERAADKQSEIDELRARRYQEAAEREWRHKEKAAAERAAAMHQDLAESREAQRESKIRQLAEMAEVEAAEFARVLAANKRKESEEMEAALAHKELAIRHKEELLQQIAANAERKELGRAAHLEDGARLREAEAAAKDRLNEIKTRKIAELEGMGVPSKYRAELERKRVGDW